MKKILPVIFLLLTSLASAFGQTTKVRGRVLEVGSGNPLPFVGVYFVGTNIGTTTDDDGYYQLETRDTAAKVLRVELLGYSSRDVEIRNGVFSNVDFALVLENTELKGAVVKADNKRVKALLSAIDANRRRNDPDSHPTFICELYNKMELDLTHPREQLNSKHFIEDFGFVFDYIDTSVVNGVPYLPMMISESVAKREHNVEPPVDRETVVANRISGVNPENNLLSQFTGSMHLKVNFYKPYINAFGVEFPSPIQASGLLFYDYFIIDSLAVDSRKTFLVRFHPKNGISSPAFDGEMLIDAEDFALRSIHAKMKHGENVNWLRDVVFDTEYERLSDSSWFYKEDKLFADFSIALSDSSKMMSVMGSRMIEYRNPDFKTEVLPDASMGEVTVAPGANGHSERYWASVRPYELSQKEKNIYKMVDLIKDVPLYQTLYDVVYTLITGYLDVGPIGFGPYYKIVSFNNLEGFRPQLGLRTTKDLSQTHRVGGYVAYGVKDHRWKGGLSYECLFSKDPTRKLTVDVHHDVFQLGKSASLFTEGNLLASLFSKGGGQRLCEQDYMSVSYENEFTPSFTLQGELAMKRYYGNAYVPMGPDYTSIATNEVHLAARFSWNETVSRGYFVKKYVSTKFPVVVIDVTGSVPGLRKNDFGYIRPELTMNWTFRIPPVGMSKLKVNAGTIFGTVPYPLLHLHESNGTFMQDKNAFSCMDYFEFASDTWASLFWNHCFNGFFLGKIPLVRKLNLREEFTLRAAYGSLSEKNRDAFFPFPEGMTSLEKIPYVEIGAGLSNILRIFRVDCFWRLTHRENADHKFVVNVGMEFRF